MNLLGYFRSQRKQTAKVAKERLQILVARERAGTRGGGPDYLPALQEELLDVIRKYVEVDRDAVQIQIEKEGDYDILELNITLPESSQK